MDSKDSLFLYADTLLLLQENRIQGQMLKAFHQVKMFMNDLQAVCDSLVYNSSDSSISMYHSPVMWSNKSQATADTIVFYLNNNRIDSFHLLSNSMLVSKVKGAHFDQVKGKDMNGMLDSSQLSRLMVYGNAQSIYYAREDSIKFIGINVIDCSEMMFYFVKGQLDQSTFIRQPEATMYTLDELKPEELRLKGFRWLEKLRPQKLNIQH